MNSSSRFVRHIPAVAAIVTSSSWTSTTNTKNNNKKSPTTTKCDANVSTAAKQSFGMIPNADGDYHNLFPKRQLWQPKVDYPLWDPNWDDKKPQPSGDPEADKNRMRRLRKEGITRHIILIRHGQYDETQKDDSMRLLTPLGRKQADLTGQRLKEMMDGASQEFGPCKIKVVRVSNMARAKETADIIASHLPGVVRANPDPDINEGRPCHNIPGGKASAATIEKTDESHNRIEKSFRQLFYRADPPDDNNNQGGEEDDDIIKHEFEIVVCHANVIRYFLCRALQIPPEAWLRLCVFNCSLTYLTIRPTGTVSCRMLGDMGHIPYGMSTFSMHTGYNW